MSAEPAFPAVRAARREDLPHVWTLLLGLAEYERWSERVTGTRFYRRMGAGPSPEGTLQFGLGREALERIAAGAAPDGPTSSVT
jgi:hypothetical protein